MRNALFIKAVENPNAPLAEQAVYQLKPPLEENTHILASFLGACEEVPEEARNTAFVSFCTENGERKAGGFLFTDVGSMDEALSRAGCRAVYPFRVNTCSYEEGISSHYDVEAEDEAHALYLVYEGYGEIIETAACAQPFEDYAERV